MCIGGGDFDVRLSEIVVPRFIDHVAWEPRKRRSPMCVNLAIDIAVDGVLIEDNKIAVRGTAVCSVMFFQHRTSSSGFLII